MKSPKKKKKKKETRKPGFFYPRYEFFGSKEIKKSNVRISTDMFITFKVPNFKICL